MQTPFETLRLAKGVELNTAPSVQGSTMTAGSEPTDGLFQAQGKVEGYGGNNLEDFSVSMKRSVGFTFHNRDRIEWKYKVAIGMEKIKMNLNPPIISNIISYH